MSSNRLAFIDILRIIGISLIIVYHVCICSVKYDPNISANIISTITPILYILSWPVLLFFIITGYIWLNNDKECTYKLCINQIKRFAITLLVAGFIFALLQRIFIYKSINLSLILKSFIDVFIGNSWDHLWFLYAIIAIYILLPLIKKLFNKVNYIHILLITAILYTCAVIAPVLFNLFNINASIDLTVLSPLFFVLIGGLISNVKISNIITKISLLSLILSLLIIVYISTNLTGLLFIIPIFTNIAPILFFILFNGLLQNKETTTSIKKIAVSVFGIYIIHPLFIHITIRLIGFYPMNNMPIISIPVISVLIFIFSYLITILYKHTIKRINLTFLQ